MLSARTSVRILPMFALVLFALVRPQTSAAAQKYMRTEADYRIPDVTLVNQEGARVRLAELLSSGKPILVSFIYTTCATISPVCSANFSNFQKRLGAEATNVKLVSITIDPETDTPEIGKQYLKRYGAKPGWDFLTGAREDIDRVMRAFDAYIPNKTLHFPLTFLKGPGKGKWVRLYGLLGTDDLIGEYRQLVRK